MATTEGSASSLTVPMRPTLEGAPSPPPPPPPPPPIQQKNSVATPPPPPVMAIEGSIMPSPPLTMRPTYGGASPPPPPPLPPLQTPSMLLKKKVATPPPPPPQPNATKLNRSAHMGSLHRALKDQVEASSHASSVTLADIMAEIIRRYPHIVQIEDVQNPNQITSGDSSVIMGSPIPVKTRLSAFLIQIETDVQAYGERINELKSAITSFKTNDMSELLKFQKHVESQLENLADETQILRRFEGFPETKLDAIRMAAALYSKLDVILTTLTNWKIESPLNQLLDKVEAYFNKIKGELDAVERSKDNVYKIFQHHKIDIDFHILVKIKESLVDISSGCMELALKEWRNARIEAISEQKKAPKWGLTPNGPRDWLWKAFQFAYRIYIFAGGQDARADELARQLAQEIQISFVV